MLACVHILVVDKSNEYLAAATIVGSSTTADYGDLVSVLVDASDAGCLGARLSPQDGDWQSGVKVTVAGNVLRVDYFVKPACP